MFKVYAPENMPTREQQITHDNRYLFSLCTWDSSLLDCIYPEGENLVVSLIKNEDKKLVSVKLDNCNNDSFKKWIKCNKSYDSDKTEDIRYTMYFKVLAENSDKFDQAWKMLYEPETKKNDWYCLLL